MPSEIEICNMALSHIGKYPIQALTEATKEAQECKRLYALIRDSVLRDHAWNFATKRLTLALLTDEIEGWDYAYQWPIDCVRALRIYNESSDNEEDAIPFEICTNSELSSRIIATDQADAVLIYTAKVTNPNVFDALFIDALSYRMAADLSLPLRGDPKLASNMLQIYQLLLSRARPANANERKAAPDESCSFIAART